MIEIIDSKLCYLCEVEFSDPKEYSYTFSFHDRKSYFRRYPEPERLKVLKEMYSIKPLQEISDLISELSQGKLF